MKYIYPTGSLLVLVAVSAMALTSAGCDFFGGEDDRVLVGTTWRLEAFLSDAAFPPPGEAFCPLGGIDCVGSDQPYTVTFQANGEVGVQADCNVCGGTYERSARELSISQLVCTEVACARGSRGAAFAAALSEAQSYRIRGDQLLIAYNEDRGLLLRATSSRPDAPPRSR